MRSALDRRVLHKVRFYCTGRGRGRAAPLASKQSPVPTSSTPAPAPSPAGPAPKSSSPGLGHGAGIAVPVSSLAGKGRGRGESPVAAVARNGNAASPGQTLQENVLAKPIATPPAAAATTTKAAKAQKSLKSAKVATPAAVSNVAGALPDQHGSQISQEISQAETGALPSQEAKYPSSQPSASLASQKPSSRLEASELFGALIQSCISRGLIYEIDYVYGAVSVARIPANIQTCQTLLDAYIQLGNFPMMDTMYKEMREIRAGQQKPEASLQEKAQASEMLSAMISSWFSRGFLQEVDLAYRGMKAGKLPVPLQAYKPVMDAYHQLGNYGAMDVVYNEMRAAMTAAAAPASSQQTVTPVSTQRHPASVPAQQQATPVSAQQQATPVSAQQQATPVSAHHRPQPVPAAPPNTSPTHGVGHGTPLQFHGMPQQHIGQPPQYQQQQTPGTSAPQFQQPVAPMQQWPQASQAPGYPPTYYPYVNMQPVVQAPIGYQNPLYSGYQHTYPGYPGYQQGYPGYQYTYPGYQPGYPGYQPGYPGFQYSPPPPYTAQAPHSVPRPQVQPPPERPPQTQTVVASPPASLPIGQAPATPVPRPKLELQPKALELLQQPEYQNLLKAAGDRAALREGVRPSQTQTYQVQVPPPAQLPYGPTVSVPTGSQFPAPVTQVGPVGHAQLQTPPQPVAVHPGQSQLPGVVLKPVAVQRPIGQLQQPTPKQDPKVTPAVQQPPEVTPTKPTKAGKTPEVKEKAETITAEGLEAMEKVTQAKGQTKATVKVPEAKPQTDAKVAVATHPAPKRDIKVKATPPKAVSTVEQEPPKPEPAKLDLKLKKPSTTTDAAPSPKLDLKLKKSISAKEEPVIKQEPTAVKEETVLEESKTDKEEPVRPKLDLKLKKPAKADEEASHAAVVDDVPKVSREKPASLKLGLKAKKEKVAEEPIQKAAEAPAEQPMKPLPSLKVGLGRGKVIADESPDLSKPLPSLRIGLKAKAAKETVAADSYPSDSEASDAELEPLPSIRKFVYRGKDKTLPAMDSVASLIGLHTPTDALLQQDEDLGSLQTDEGAALPALPFESRRGKGRGKVIDQAAIAAEEKRLKLKREEAAAKAMAILESAVGKSQMSAYLERRKKRSNDQFSLGEVPSRRTSDIKTTGTAKKSKSKQMTVQGVIDHEGAIEYAAPQEYMEKGDALTEVEEAIKGTLHRHFMLDVDPEAAMEEFGTNPDIDDKPLPTLEEALEKAKEKLMAQDEIDETVWEEAVQDVKERAPQLQNLLQSYTGPQKKTAKQNNKVLHNIVAELPPFATPELAAFAKRAMITLQNNPGWSQGSKKQLLSRLVADAKQLHERGA